MYRSGSIEGALDVVCLPGAREAGVRQCGPSFQFSVGTLIVKASTVLMSVWVRAYVLFTRMCCTSRTCHYDRCDGMNCSYRIHLARCDVLKT